MVPRITKLCKGGFIEDEDFDYFKRTSDKLMSGEGLNNTEKLIIIEKYKDLIGRIDKDSTVYNAVVKNYKKDPITSEKI